MGEENINVKKLSYDELLQIYEKVDAYIKKIDSDYKETERSKENV